jgi:magnesium chelatase subunit H
MPKPTTAADAAVGMRVTIITLDGHLGAAADRAFRNLRRQAPSLDCRLHVAGEWAANPVALEACHRDIARSDILIVCMLFMEDHINAVLPQLTARRDQCDAILCFMSAGDVMRLTRIGGLSMDGEQRGPLALLKKLRGARTRQSQSSGARQIAMLKKLPRILRFIPGTAQDLRAYFLGMQYWLAGSDQNIRNLVALMVTRYAQGPRRRIAEKLSVAPPVEYPDVGIYHPRLAGRVAYSRDALDAVSPPDRPAVGVLLMRSYILAGNTAHYDMLIEAIEALGLSVVPVYAAGLDARPAVERFLLDGDRPRIDAFVSLTGF